MGVIEPLYLALHLPEFPAQALLRLRPELASSAVAVLDGNPPFERVCSLNRHAARLGVSHGAVKSELDMFPAVTVLRRSQLEEAGAKAALLQLAGLFTPRVEVHAGSGMELALVLDMAGTARIFGTTEQAAQRVEERLRAAQFSCRMAASANQHTALCAAAFARTRPVLIAAGQEAKALSQLPLAALPLTPVQAETLALWGLRTVGELAALPEVEVVVRLGQAGKRLHLLARGAHPHLMVPQEMEFTLEERIAFDAPVEQLESLLFVLGPMLDQLLLRAQDRSFALASVTAELALEGGGQHSRTLKPALPVLEREILLRLLHLDLQAHPPPAGVVGIYLTAEPGDRSKVQLGLWSPQLPEPARLDVTLARIAALVGEERVGRPRLLDAHKPDSFQMERFGLIATKTNTTEAKHTVAIRRFRPPVSLPIAGPTEPFWFRGKRYVVEAALGPWRRSGQWWSPEMWSEEEWDVRGATEAGEALVCLFGHDLLRKAWCLEGVYD